MSFLKLTAASAALAVTATGVLAEAHAMDTDNLIRTRDITGGTVYRMDADDTWGNTAMYDGVADTWNDIGEIEDLVLSPEGQLVGIIAEVGGFLDIGDKHVLIPVDGVRLAAVDDATYAYVTNLTEEEIEAMDEVDEGFWD